MTPFVQSCAGKATAHLSERCDTCTPPPPKPPSMDVVVAAVRKHDAGLGARWDAVCLELGVDWRGTGDAVHLAEEALNDAMDAGLVHEPRLGTLRLMQ